MTAMLLIVFITFMGIGLAFKRYIKVCLFSVTIL